MKFILRDSMIKMAACNTFLVCFKTNPDLLWSIEHLSWIRLNVSQVKNVLQTSIHWMNDTLGFCEVTVRAVIRKVWGVGIQCAWIQSPPLCGNAAFLQGMYLLHHSTHSLSSNSQIIPLLWVTRKLDVSFLVFLAACLMHGRWSVHFLEHKLTVDYTANFKIK